VWDECVAPSVQSKYLRKIGVAELKYEIQKSKISNSYSLRLVRLCPREIHTYIQQRPNLFFSR
jgi:hypothetical protein